MVKTICRILVPYEYESEAQLIGIMLREEFKRRTVAIAKGEYKPRKDEPKIWFGSLQSFA